MIHRDAKKKFLAQRSLAKRRGIPFPISFEEWRDWWLETGKWEQRGVGRGKYCMARRSDNGPYELGNIYCTTNEKNGAEIDRDRCRAGTMKGLKLWAKRIANDGILPAGSLAFL